MYSSDYKLLAKINIVVQVSSKNFLFLKVKNVYINLNELIFESVEYS